MSGERAQDTRQITVRQPYLHMHRFRIDVIAGPDEGASIAWDGEDCNIGTAQSNELALRDGSVSRHHCTITPHPKYFRIVDNGSTNGTFVDGVRIEAARLPKECQLRVGITKMRFSTLADTFKQELVTESEFGGILGESAAMRRIFKVLPRIANTDATVLILGETGTGKSALASVLHQLSPRADGPLIDVDCGAIAPSLLESELFGHERGAFTGAHAAKPGVLELAKGGTVLLDEIGELPLEMQPKLLRAIEQRRIRRIGGTQSTVVDCRIIATTNRNLRREVNRGAFRSDLFYRLNIVALEMPPLRDRPEDIPPLAYRFLEELVSPQEVSQYDQLVDEWAKRDWPGNVRELKNAVTRSVVLDAPSGRIASVFPPALHPPPSSSRSGTSTMENRFEDEAGQIVPFRVAKQHAIGEWERAYIEHLLDRADGNLSQAARLAKTDRAYLRGMARKYDLLD